MRNAGIGMKNGNVARIGLVFVVFLANYLFVVVG
jgi:hypothetical protein